MSGSNAILAGTALLVVGMPIQATQRWLRQLMMGIRPNNDGATNDFQPPESSIPMPTSPPPATIG